MLSRWLRLWFGFRDPVSRGTYFRHGAGLMAFKYAIDALLVWTFAGRFWTPLDYANPVWSARYELLRGAPSWLAPLMVAIALPFVWIGVSMTMRRTIDAGASPWTALIFFVPLLNFVLMAVLSLVPSASRVEWPVEPPPPAVDDRLKSAMLGVAASLGITLVTVGVGIYLRRSYSTGLFLGVPFTIGYISSYIYNYNYPRPAGQSIMIAVASVTIAAGALVVFALEGVVCVTMALPIALAIAFPGAVLGRMVARQGVHAGAGAGMGRTAYVVDMFPQRYWTLPAGRIVAAIHERVLRHIAALAEEEEP